MQTHREKYILSATEFQSINLTSLLAQRHYRLFISHKKCEYGFYFASAIVCIIFYILFFLYVIIKLSKQII